MEDIATEEESVSTIAENENEGVEEPTESKPVKE